ncbi:MAG: phosphoribosyl-ATP diphosphatase [Mariniblastus sp.]
MIIPILNHSNYQSELEDCLSHWSLFGAVAVSNVKLDDVESMESIVQRIGGRFDLLIELESLNENDALRLLNAGAASIICREASDASALENIPADRLTFMFHDDATDQAIPKGHIVSLLPPSEPTADRMAELEMARVDCFVDAEFLNQNSQMILDFFKQVLITDRPDGLWSTLIVDPLGIALGLAYSNEESLLHAIENRCGTYWSRSRDGLWIKGETSGATQQLLGIRMDCDRDCLRFMVTQDAPGFCHRDTHTCFGEERTIQSVVQRLGERISETDEKSFTRKLATDAKLLETKLLEEAKELSDASQLDDKHEIAWEAADVMYFSLVAMIKNGVGLESVYHELARRMNRVVRRKNKLESENDSE